MTVADQNSIRRDHIPVCKGVPQKVLDGDRVVDPVVKGVVERIHSHHHRDVSLGRPVIRQALGSGQEVSMGDDEVVRPGG